MGTGQWPHAVFIKFSIFSLQHFTEFSIFDFRKKSEDIEIVAGTNKLQSGGLRYKIDKAISHEEFGNPPFSHDIALVRLQKSIQFGDNVQPIKYSKKVVEAGAHLQVSGWGQLWEDGLSPLDLQVLNVTSISDEECKLKSPKTFHESHLCTLNPDGQGVCTVC